MNMNKNLRVLLYETPYDPYMNLAFEESFFIVQANNVNSSNTIRIWRNANAVVIGYFQKAVEEVNFEEANKIGAVVTRRFTGGGAVYHDLGNINYAIAYKVKKKIDKPLDTAFRYLIKGVLFALKYLNLEAELENINDVVVGNHKVSGTVASYKQDTLFLHGSILVSTDLEKLYNVLKVSRKKLEDKKISSIKYRVTTISNILKRKISYKEIIKAFVKGYEELFNAEAYYDLPESIELNIAEILYKYKYSLKEWNLERSMHENIHISKKINDLLSEVKS